ncbi:hypothetical protein AMTRI_Chr04g251080 [Amborella trichopoda]
MRILSLSLTRILNQIQPLTPPNPSLCSSLRKFLLLALYFLVLETGLDWLHKKLWRHQLLT